MRHYSSGAVEGVCGFAHKTETNLRSTDVAGRIGAALCGAEKSPGTEAGAEFCLRGRKARFAGWIISADSRSTRTTTLAKLSGPAPQTWGK
jgi:hypothetical protein